AEYDSGEIVIDPKELLEANWYRYDDLPLLPPPGTVARRLIEEAAGDFRPLVSRVCRNAGAR
ncbi:hypothetical protein MJN54_30415, partial [Salmonella enterica subsp. enterica serovar Kentucky]|nr:hypothetical protein [Salmonella enterica subsp. enterica serovar Kentucky]